MMEYNKVFVIQVDSVLKYPPTIALINDLVRKGKKVYLFSTYFDGKIQKILPDSVECIKIGSNYEYNSNRLEKFKNLFLIHRSLIRKIERLYDEDTILWIMSNITIKHMGKSLFKYRYNLHLFELIDSMYYFGKNPLMKIDIKRICDHANKVITCEYNRACITQAWFNLKERPLTIVNKPAPNNICKCTEVFHDDKAKNIVDDLKGKKIILYQGIVDAERPIEVIAQAVEEISGFVFLIMTGSECDDLKKYKNTIVIPYIEPPYHLEVTSHAYIGVLLYVPVYGTFTSPLNSIYCAPNKLYEYSQFSLPMIGNDIPGLKYSIESNGMGKCIETLEKKNIINAIKDIDDAYSEMSRNSKLYFEGTTNEEAIVKALRKN
ncbi:hypothetical protein [Butyrivibrio sp. WCD3002]|uniref:hypothetical protein n=1 Tax=Butyrivibrio sp. WCD3002 TaxID=1280676 RepID=UPI000688A435|nr:hypothetical protein [Butyrivibrio sp. WCD3002]